MPTTGPETTCLPARARRGRLTNRIACWLRLPEGDLWRDRAYARLWASILTSSFGNQVMILALPLTAAVLPQVPRAAGDPGVTLTVRPLGPLEATCDPWPFAGAEVAVPVRVRVIADRPYASDADLQGALRAAPWETRAYTLSRPGT